MLSFDFVPSGCCSEFTVAGIRTRGKQEDSYSRDTILSWLTD